MIIQPITGHTIQWLRRRVVFDRFGVKLKNGYKPIHIVVLCFVFLLLGGCSAKGTAKIPNSLYIRLKKNPTTLDPAKIVDLDSARIAAKLFNGLVCFDNSLSVVPDIAASWRVSDDGLTYHFNLKKGVRFFNGREVTASDFAFSFRRVLDPATRSPRTWVLSRIKGAVQFMTGEHNEVAGIRVKGPYELEITLEEPFAPFISFLGLTAAYVVAREEVQRWQEDFGFHSSGTGPYILKEWQHNQFLLLGANKNYFNTAPLLSGIYYKIVPEDFTALVEFEKGDLDILPEILASEYKRFAGDARWQPYIKMAQSLNTYYLGLNCQVAPFNDKRVRKAMNLAIDREKILATLMEGRGTGARGPLPPLLRGGPAPQGYPYNPARAIKLLQEAGYPQGFVMTLYQTADVENLDICQVIQSYLRDVGIDARIVQLEWSTFLDVVARGEATSFWLSWWADYPDAENFLFPLFHSKNWGPGGNRSRFKNERIDTLLSQAVVTLDDAKRRSLYHIAEEIIIDEAPWVFFWHKSVGCIHQPWVKGYTMKPLAVMEKSTAVYIARSMHDY